MDKNTFGAWSIYTGPSNVSSVAVNSTYVYGQWDGINATTGPDEIKKDLDARIQLFLGAVKSFMTDSKSVSSYFAAPEFFFHCKQGPYPDVLINGKTVFDYLKGELTAKLPSCMKTNQTMTVLIGTILTCNVQNYDTFFESRRVKERLALLNQYKTLFAPAPPTLIAQRSTKNKKVSKNKKRGTRKSRSGEEQEQESKGVYVEWKRHLIQKPQKPKKKSKGRGKEPLGITLLDLMGQFKRDPLCLVRNRGIYFYFASPTAAPVIRVHEKQHESTIDLTMGVYNAATKSIEIGGMITQWMSGYPTQTIQFGDKQIGLDYQINARFQDPEVTTNNDIGLEICVDHGTQRLRRTCNMKQANGAKYDTYPITKQFVVSAGMYLQSYSIATDANSVIFNSDGLTTIKDYPSPQRSALGIYNGVYTLCSQTQWQTTQSKDGQIHFSHSQLATTISTSKLTGYNNELGINNPTATTYTAFRNNPVTDKFKVYFSNVPAIVGGDGLFCCGAGEIHRYSALG